MRLIVGALLMSLLRVPAASAMPERVVALDSLRWKHRVLLLPPMDDESPVVDWAADADALLDRHLILFREEDGEYRQLFPKPTVPTRLELDVETRDRATGDVTLIGKDGTIKRRWQRESSKLPDAVFALIDSMPMRQREMRREE